MKVDKVINIEHFLAAFEKYHIIWHTENLPAVRHFVDAVPEDATSNGMNCRQLILDVIDHFEKVVPPLYAHMTKSQIHGDFNEGLELWSI